MGIKLGKKRRGTGMALGTLLGQVCRVDAGGRVILGKYRMGGVTVGATGNLVGSAKPVVFAVIALQVRFNGNVGDLVPGHHLCVTVTIHADFGVEFTPLVIGRSTHFVDGMKIVAVVAGR